MDISDAILGRRTAREYTAQAVDESVIRHLIDAAFRARSVAQSFVNTAKGKAAFGLPAAWLSVLPIIVGHPKCAPAPVPRRAPEIRWIG